MVTRRPAPVDGGRLDSRSYRWFALRVTPQQETLAATILADRGFATFVPVRRQWEFANGANRARVIKGEKMRPLMPGYVFIGMGDGTPGWSRALCFRFVHGVIGLEGEPMEIPHDDRPGRPGLRQLMWRQAGGEFNAPDYQRWQASTQRTWEIGDVVTTPDEVLRGKVLDVDGDQAVLLAEFLGGVREIRADVSKLRRADD